MLKTGNWLILENRDVVEMSVNVGQINAVEKHFLESKGRSILCRGPGNCDLCGRVPRRMRYISDVLIDGERYLWEFGDDVFQIVMSYAATAGYVKVSVTRLGQGRRTIYQVRQQESDTPQSVVENCHRCKICGGVQINKLLFEANRQYIVPALSRCACTDVPQRVEK